MKIDDVSDAHNLFKMALKIIYKEQILKGYITLKQFGNEMFRTRDESLGLIYTLKGMKQIAFYEGDNKKIRLTPIGRKNLVIILTGGVFDILHVGHLLTLEKAKELGDFLVVVVASDSVVKKNKGENNPINIQSKRAELLRHLKDVDYVIEGVEGGDDNSNEFYEVIADIKPNYIILGYDQRHEEERLYSTLKEKGLDEINVQRLDKMIPNEKSSNKLEAMKKKTDQN